MTGWASGAQPVVSVDFDDKVSGDFLLPVYENDNSLVFAQAGMRNSNERDIYNLGLGYRWYTGDWMYGANTFYDYDHTGHNRRLGIGGEAWTDYLKLSANGYFRLTNWHQSVMHDMQDYDERPANGFDIRAEAYLPSHPQLGGSLKYEQYFGEGVDLSGDADPDDLKRNAAAVTVGVSYTPFPLLTVKAEQRMGDDRDTSLSMDFTYRPGVPWSQQINGDYVDMQRSLMGSRYELVDRNYDIVMQYRKQDLLRISLPPEVSAKATEVITLPLTVSKAKYGVKEVEWNVPAEFTANGGTYRVLSKTELEVTAPAYQFATRSEAQKYEISAVATDNNNNRSNTAKTALLVAPSDVVVSTLDVSPASEVLANNSDYFTVVATVKDGSSAPVGRAGSHFHGQRPDRHQRAICSHVCLPLPGRVTPAALTVTTNALGQATVRVRSTVGYDRAHNYRHTP
ncbi:inverse autotransporter beta domain-containing protein [Mangrovibacter sp. SLW1]